MEVKVKRPGKLFIAGEYAVVESGYKALVIAVDRFIEVSIKKSKQACIFSDSIGQSIIEKGQASYKFSKTSSKDPRWSYINQAIRVCEAYLSVDISFDGLSISIESQMEDSSGKKYGLGSSASVTVAVIDAIFKFYKKEIDPMTLYKLSVLATLEISPNNSCGDIAAISFLGFVYYQKFDKDKLLGKMKNQSIKSLVNSDWDLLVIEKLNIDNFDFVIGWTGSPASSNYLVKKIKDQDHKKDFYKAFIEKSDRLVLDLKESFEKEDFPQIKEKIMALRNNLQGLQEEFKCQIETQKLKDLSDIGHRLGFASKLSGAGGGDCGIAIGQGSLNKAQLIELWQEKNIEYLDLKVYKGEVDV